MLIRIVKMTFHPDRVESFLSLFESVKTNKDVDNDHVLFTISIWQSQKDLQDYRNSNLFLTTWKKTKTYFSDNAEAWSLNIISEDFENEV